MDSREKTIFDGIRDGLPLKDIARDLEVHPRTITREIQRFQHELRERHRWTTEDGARFRWVLSTFVDLGLDAARDVLLGRDLASSVPLGGMMSAFRRAPLDLLPQLAELGADDQVATLSRRLTDEFDLSAEGSTVRLADVMRSLGRQDDARRLVRRARDSGHYWLALKLDDELAARFPHGREPDGTPSPAWRWSEVIADAAGERQG
jgi:hypothetical protein